MAIKKFISLPYLLFSFIILAALMVFSALFELNQSKKELLELMQENARATLDGAVHGSIFNIRSGRLLEDEVANRLMDNITFVGHLIEDNKADKKTLNSLLQANDLLQIAIIDKDLDVRTAVFQKEILSGAAIPGGEYFRHDNQALIERIIVHNSDSTQIFSAVRELKNGGFILVSMAGKVLLSFRKQAGIGSLISEIAANKNIVYLAVQDDQGILAAKNVDSLSSIHNDPGLIALLSKDSTISREINFQGSNVLEIVQAFQLSDDIRALFRMGLSLQPLEKINERIMRRIIIITAVLVILGLLFFTILNIRQQYDKVNYQYGLVQTHFKNVVNAINEGIITADHAGLIKTMNPAAESILGLKEKKWIGQKTDQLPLDLSIDGKSGEKEGFFSLGSINKYLSINISPMETAGDKQSGTLLLIRDLSGQKNLEEQLRQKERLTAMGQLASGVAHEVRNPLNAISTIIQQFDMDFEPRENADEYHSLARLVIKEVKRINQIITRFVSFARPPKLNIEDCRVDELLQEMVDIARKSVGEKKINLSTDIERSVHARWDGDQIRQVMINLSKNAIAAIENKGTIKLNMNKENGQIRILFADDGAGIREDHLNKIFNLYFTTKPEGTGFGLSDVHRIISQHGGHIDVFSKPGQGTTFILTIPAEANYE